MLGEYKYLAFISYKREDEKWAKWLQNKLEHYKLPTSVRKVDPSLPERVSPVFKDTTDLSGGVLEKAIKNALVTSKYLIVICSPRATQSQWVCKEVQEFIDSGREEYIIPFIVEGEPNSNYPILECFPENLRGLSGNRELLGISINEMGRDAAAIKVVARMFNLHFDVLWQRWAREQRNHRRWTISLISFAAFIFLTVACVMYFQQQRMQENLARAVANRAEQLINEGNSYLARKLLLEVLPDENDIFHYPYTAEAEAAMRRACEDKSVIFSRSHKYFYNYDIRPSFTDDGKLICFGEPDDTTIKLWDIEKMMFDDMVFKGHTQHIKNAFASPNGQYIISYSNDETIKVWNVYSGKCMYTIEEQSDVSELLFSPDNKCFLSVSGKTINLWNTESGKLQESFIHSKGVETVSFSNDGKFIVSASPFDDKVKLWSIDKGECLDTYDGYHMVSSAVFSPDGKYIALSDGTILYVDKNEVFYSFELVNNFMLFSPDCKYILVEYKSGVLGLFSIETKQCVKIFKGHNGFIQDATFSPDGKYLVSASSDKTVKLWSVETAECLQNFEGHKNYVDKVVFSPDGKYLISDSGYEVKIWNIEQQVLNQVLGFRHWIDDISFSQNGQYIINDSYRSMEIRNIQTWERIKLPEYILDNHCVSYKDNIYMLSYNYNLNVMKLWNVITGECMTSFNIEDGQRPKLYVISPDASYVAVVLKSNQANIFLWDVSKGEQICSFGDDTDNIEKILFSPNGKYILAESRIWRSDMDDEYTVKLWSTETGKSVKTFDGYKFPLNRVVFSPNSRMITLENPEYKRKLIYDIRYSFRACEFNSIANFSYSNSGSELVLHGFIMSGLQIFKGHRIKVIKNEGAFSKAIFSPDDKYIATISSTVEGMAQLWDVKSGRCAYTFDEKEKIKDIAFSPDGKKLLCVLDNSRKVIIRDLKSLQQLIEESKVLFEGNPLTSEERREYYLD